MVKFSELGMLNGDYVMISLDMLYSSCQVGDNRDVEACKAFEGMLMISPYEPATESYENFKIEVHRRMPELNYSMKSPADVSIEFAELHTENCLSEICPEYYSRMFHFFLSLTQHNNRFSAALHSFPLTSLLVSAIVVFLVFLLMFIV